MAILIRTLTRGSQVRAINRCESFRNICYNGYTKDQIKHVKRLLLLIPPYISFESFKSPLFTERNNTINTDMPLGAISISSYVKKYANSEVKILDFNPLLYSYDSSELDSFGSFFKHHLGPVIKDYNPDAIGISILFTASYSCSLELASIVKEINPNSFVFAGGGVPTSMWKYMFKSESPFDALSYGEGERPINDLLNSDNFYQLIASHSSWITPKKALDQTFEPKHDWISDLDEIPIYDYEELEIDNYAIAPVCSGFSSHNESKIIFNMATSRGCPYKCTFCASHDVHGYTMRYHSRERIYEDIRLLKQKYGCQRIAIQDDHFMGDHRRAKDIIRFIKDMDIQVFFQSGVTMFSLTRDMLELMVESGINEIVLPIESGSERIAKEVMKKGHVSRKIIHRVVKDCRELGIQMDGNILCGMPGETEQDIQEGLDFLKSLDVNWYRIHVATPLPGSELFDDCVEKGYIDEDGHIGGDYKRAKITTPDFSPDYIEKRAYEMNLELNFIFNSDFRLGLYEKSFSAFQNVINITTDHAFAYYFAAKSLLALENIALYNEYATIYNRIASDSQYWQAFIHKYGLNNRLEIIPKTSPNHIPTSETPKVKTPVSGILTQASTPL